MITAYCQVCGYQLNLPASVVGKKGKCPSCKQPTLIDPSFVPGSSQTTPANRQWRPSAPAPPQQPSQQYPSPPPAPAYRQSQWTAPAPVQQSNPYNTPQSTGVNLTVNVGSASQGQFTKRELSQLDSCSNGLSMIFWGMNAVAGCLIGFIFLGITAANVRSLDTARIVGILTIVLVVIIIIAAIVQIVGHGLLMSAPPRSGAKGLLIAAFICSIAQPISSIVFNLVAQDQIMRRNFDGAGAVFIVSGLIASGLSISAFVTHFLGLGRLFDFSINYGSRPIAIMWACLVWLGILIIGAVIVGLNPREQIIAVVYAIIVLVLPLGIIVSYVRMIGNASRYIRDLLPYA